MSNDLTPRSDTALVKSTVWEEVVQRVRGDKQATQKEDEQKASARLKEKRQIDLLKAIGSVYYFLRINGMRHGPLSVEEFEAAEAELKRLAVAAVEPKGAKNPIGYCWRWFKQFLLGLGDTPWNFYLDNGYFYCSPPHIKSPFAGSKCLWGYSELFEPYYFAGYAKEHTPVSFFKTIEKHCVPNSDFPTNLETLYNSLLRKRNLK